MLTGSEEVVCPAVLGCLFKLVPRRQRSLLACIVEDHDELKLRVWRALQAVRFESWGLLRRSLRSYEKSR
jgi:hypothetical protein